MNLFYDKFLRLIYLKNTNLDLINKSQKNELSDEEQKYNEAHEFL